MRSYKIVVTAVLLTAGIWFTQQGQTQTHRKLIVASTSDLASIAQFIAGDNYEALSVMEGGGNPSLLIPSKITVLRAKKAETYFNFGNQLEAFWEPSFFSDAEAPAIEPGSTGYHTVTEGITLLPTSSAESTIQPVMHQAGNPYVWLDPNNCKQIAQNIAAVLSARYPSDQPVFQANKERLIQEIDVYIERINKRLKPFENTKVAAFDHSFDYFARRFGIAIAEYIQPAPGVIPNTKRIKTVADSMSAQNIHTVLVPDYLSDRFVQQLSEHIQVKHIKLPVCGGKEWATDYFKFLNQFTQTIIDGFKAEETKQE
ncbi:zinc ABC transporter substrate-binding protein [bacterium]|nr:zinc ABC transporter substrate-binding protein [bacterium]